jgi:hypothetical protein
VKKEVTMVADRMGRLMNAVEVVATARKDVAQDIIDGW